MLSHYYFETGKKEMSIWTIINTAVSLVSIRKEKQRNGWILRFSLWHFEAGNKIIIKKILSQSMNMMKKVQQQ